MMTGVLLLILVILLIAAPVAIYNQLIVLRQRVKNGFSQIDVQLKRRHDLIPNLVETAKGYMAHERGTLDEVIKARNMAIGAQGVAQQAEAENMLSGALKSLFAVVENYPNLKADTQMLALQEELTNTENKISFARQYYNDEVMRYNTQIAVFPANVVAGSFGFGKEEFFQVESAEDRAVPKVQF
jgi:LemA protein